jgi:hypothetical protein
MAINPEIQRQNVLEEYKALRAEIILLVQMRNQFWIYDLTGFGVFVGLAFQSHTYIILLVAPLVHYPLMMYWSYADRHILKIGLYIKNALAPRLHGLGWEAVVSAERLNILDMPVLPKLNEYISELQELIFPKAPRLSKCISWFQGFFLKKRFLDNELAAFITFAGTTVITLLLWTSELVFSAQNFSDTPPNSLSAPANASIMGTEPARSSQSRESTQPPTSQGRVIFSPTSGFLILMDFGVILFSFHFTRRGSDYLRDNRRFLGRIK